MKTKIMLLLIILITSLFGGCIEQDTDGDGYEDEIDDFPEDPNYHSDFDGDGCADEIDNFPGNYKFQDELDRLDDIDDPAELNRIGDKFDDGGYIVEANMFYNKSFLIEPDNKSTLRRIIFSETDLRNYDRAYALSNKLIEIDPNDSLSYILKGNVLWGMGQLDEALECANIALEIDPNDSVNYVLKGNMLLGMGQLDEALECANIALEIDQGSEFALNLKESCEQQKEIQQQTKTQASQFFNIRYQKSGEMGAGAVLYVFADAYGASDSKATSLARTTSYKSIANGYDAVVVYLTDRNTGTEYYGEYKITNYYG